MARRRGGRLEIWWVILFVGCASRPDYVSPPANVPQALLDLRQVPAPTLLIDGQRYGTGNAPIPNKIRVAANQPISVLSYYFSWGGHCTPSITFIPKEGRSYVVKHVVLGKICHLEMQTGDGRTLPMRPSGIPRFTLRPPALIKDEGTSPPPAAANQQ